MTRKIAIINQKGGVGKTATAYNLAFALADHGKKTLLVDLDPSANSTRGTISHYDDLDVQTISDLLIDRKARPEKVILQASVHGKEFNNLSIIPSDIRLAKVARTMMNLSYKETLLEKQLQKIQSKFDYILLDCLPTLTDLNINAIYASDFFLIPIEYAKDALEGMSDLFEIISEIKMDEPFDYRILRNGYDGRTKVINSLVNKQMEGFIKKNVVFNTVIKKNEDINKAKANNEPVLTYAPNSTACEDYKSLMMEVLNV